MCLNAGKRWKQELRSLTYPDTGETIEFVEHSRPYVPTDHTMGGYNSKTGRKIDEIERLTEEYKKTGQTVDPKYWQ